MNWIKTTILNARQTGCFAPSIIGTLSLWGRVWHNPSLLDFAPDLGEETRMSVEKKIPICQITPLSMNPAQITALSQNTGAWTIRKYHDMPARKPGLPE